MTHTAYQWRGDLFCEGDIVAYLTDTPPYSDWLDANHVPGDETTETDLNELAEMFGIDRSNPEACALHGFPFKLTIPPDPPQFCAGCFCWFA